GVWGEVGRGGGWERAWPWGSGWEPARPSRAASAPNARFLPCFFSRRVSHALAFGDARSSRHVASEKAHFRWALPIWFPPVPCFLPADSWAQRTRRGVGGDCPAGAERGV